MDSQFKSSFIPRNDSVGQMAPESKTSFLGFLAVLIFIVSLLGVGGLFAYKKTLQNSFEEKRLALEEAEAGIDSQGIKKIITFDKKVKAIKEIAAHHVTVSSYLAMLEKRTVSRVGFLDLKYYAAKGMPISVEMQGEAPSYGAVAEQENLFLTEPNFVSANFDNLSVKDKTGNIAFTFKGKFKEDLVRYKPPVSAITTSVASTTADESVDLEASLQEINNISSDI